MTQQGCTTHSHIATLTCPQATEALKITASDLTKAPTKIMDDVVPEPLGGAHTDPMASFPLIKDAILKHYNDLKDMDELELRLDRYAKFRQLGLYEEFLVFGGQREAAVAERNAVRCLLRVFGVVSVCVFCVVDRG